MSFFYFLLIGLLAGWIAGLILKGRGFGVLGDLIIGCIGSLFGGFLFDLLGIPIRSLAGSLICAIIGAIAFIYLVRFLRRNPL